MANPHPIPHPHPNMNLKNEPKPGPTSELGKFRISLNALKPYTLHKQMQLHPEDGKHDSLLTQLIKDNRTEETNQLLKYLTDNWQTDAIKRYNFLLLWLKSHTKRDLKALSELENLYMLFEPKVTTEFLDKVAKNEPLTRIDLEKAKFLRDTLAMLHELKFGKKQINVQTSFKDIRDLMGFEKMEEKETEITQIE